MTSLEVTGVCEYDSLDSSGIVINLVTVDLFGCRSQTDISRLHLSKVHLRPPIQVQV